MSRSNKWDKEDKDRDRAARGGDIKFGYPLAFALGGFSMLGILWFTDLVWRTLFGG